MKNLFIVLFFLFTITISAQVTKVSYEQIFNTSTNTLVKEYELIFNDTLSLYLEKSGSSREKNNGDGLRNMTTQNLNVGGKTNKNFYFSNKQTFIFQETFFGKAKKIIEDDDLGKWKKIDSVKVIAGYTCKLATKEFRGRKYFVWYALQIPTSSGPWKFNKLGGLILEVRDKKGQFSIQAKKISFFKPKSKKGKFYTHKLSDLNKKSNDWNLISMNELKQFIKEKDELMLQRIKEQLPRGSKAPKLDNDCEDCKNSSLENY